MLFSIIFYILVLIFLLLIAGKLYIKLRTRWSKCYTCLTGKTTIVTGSNTGIGYYTALDFAKRGARVILACRNLEKAEEARRKIINATDNNNVVVKLVNFTSLESVRDFCRDINESESRLDILVNNAGAASLGNKFSEDDLQITWQTNHLSAFLLTHLLIDKMKKSSPSRIVMVSSILASFAKFDIEKLNTYPDASDVVNSENKLYSKTKQANILFARELNKRLKGTGVTINALHPGVINTDIWRRIPRKIQPVFNVVKNIFFKTSEEGAQTTIYCAVSKDLNEVSGELFDECRRIKTYGNCTDMNQALSLWEKCEELVKLQEHEKIK